MSMSSNRYVMSMSTSRTGSSDTSNNRNRFCSSGNCYSMSMSTSRSSCCGRSTTRYDRYRFKRIYITSKCKNTIYIRYSSSSRTCSGCYIMSMSRDRYTMSMSSSGCRRCCSTGYICDCIFSRSDSMSMSASGSASYSCFTSFTNTSTCYICDCSFSRSDSMSMSTSRCSISYRGNNCSFFSLRGYSMSMSRECNTVSMSTSAFLFNTCNNCSFFSLRGYSMSMSSNRYAMSMTSSRCCCSGCFASFTSIRLCTSTGRTGSSRSASIIGNSNRFIDSTSCTGFSRCTSTGRTSSSSTSRSSCTGQSDSTFLYVVFKVSFGCTNSFPIICRTIFDSDKFNVRSRKSTVALDKVNFTHCLSRSSSCRFTIRTGCIDYQLNTSTNQGRNVLKCHSSSIARLNILCVNIIYRSICTFTKANLLNCQSRHDKKSFLFYI